MITDFITRAERVYDNKPHRQRECICDDKQYQQHERINKIITRISGATLTIMIALVCTYCVASIFIK